MLIRLIERLTGRTRRTAQPARASAAIPVEQRASMIEARVRADIAKRDVLIRQQWEEVQAITGPSRRGEPQADAIGRDQDYHQQHTQHT